MESDSRSSFLKLVQANPVNAALLNLLPRLNLPDCWLVAGCLFQSVWNGLTNKHRLMGSMTTTSSTSTTLI